MNSFLFRIPKDHYSAFPTWINALCHLIPLVFVPPFWRGFHPSESQLGAIISAMSIFAALLFGILIPAADQARRLRDQRDQIPAAQPGENESTEIKLQRKMIAQHHDVAKKILASVAYSIIVSLASVFFLVISFCLRPDSSASEPEKSSILYLGLLSVSAYTFIFLLELLFLVVRSVYGSWFKEAE